MPQISADARSTTTLRAKKSACWLPLPRNTKNMHCGRSSHGHLRRTQRLSLQATEGPCSPGWWEEPVTVQLIEYPKLLAAALEEAVASFALEDFRKGLGQGRFELAFSERLLDRILVWSLAGFIIEHYEQGTAVSELQSAYAILVLTNLGVEASEARQLDEQAQAELA